MSSQGSECFPIDLTEDESPPKKPKMEKVRNVKGLKSITQRLEIIEEKIKNIEQRNENLSLSYAKKDAAAEFLDKCKTLESRLESLESYLERVSQVFLNSFGGSNPHVNDEENVVYNRDVSPNIAEELQDLHHNEAEQESNVIYQDSGDEAAPCEMLRMDGVEFNSLDEDRNEMVMKNNCNEIEVEEHFDLKPDPVWVKMPKLPSIKKELNLMRDDQGRVLMFLCCSAKKLFKDKPHIAAVAGVYLCDQLHNEFPFVSDQKTKDVKITAEIKAALFGIETIKRVFSETLGDLCVMVISTCQPLVKLMRNQSVTKVYPNINSCDCEPRDCQHSDFRWASQDGLGKSYIDVLPDLMLSLRALQVHWCSIENISDQEKETAATYAVDVEAYLTEYVALNKNKS